MPPRLANSAATRSEEPPKRRDRLRHAIGMTSHDASQMNSSSSQRNLAELATVIALLIPSYQSFLAMTLIAAVGIATASASTTMQTGAVIVALYALLHAGLIVILVASLVITFILSN